MKTINLYIFKNLLFALIAAMVIATFVMLIGQFAKVFDLLSRGVELNVLVRYVWYRVPQALGYTIPVALFIATALIFNRMSTDHEITGLRASGISINQIIAPVVILSFLLSALCLYLQLQLSPESVFQAKWLVREASIQNPMALIEDGRFVEIFDGYILYVGDKNDDELSDIHLYVLDADDRIQQKIDAGRGAVAVSDELSRLELTLYDATIESIDPEHPTDISKIHRVRGETCTFNLSYGDKIHQRPLVRKISEMRVSQLLARIQIRSERGIDTTPLYVELHLRSAMALSPFSFVLLGIPLGVGAPRRDSSYGIFAGVLIPLGYFAVLAFFETLNNNPHIRPELLMWLPNMVCQAAGIYALWVKR